MAQDALYRGEFRGPAGSRPEGWKFFGPESREFWFQDGGTLNSGPGDKYPLGASYALIDTMESAGWADVTVSSTITVVDPDGSGKISLILRAKDSNNFYIASLAAAPASGGQPAYRGVEIAKMIASREVELAAVQHGNGVNLPEFERAGSSFKFQFSAKGSLLTVFLDGQPVLTASDSELARGSAGVGQLFSHVKFGDLTVSAGGPAGGTVLAQATPRPAATTAAPPSGGDGGTWRIVSLSDLTEADAKQRAKEVESEVAGMQVVALPGASGWNIYIGAFRTEQEAASTSERLAREGVVVTGYEFVREGGRAGATAKTTGPRVSGGDFDNETQAFEARSKLTFAGFYPVEVVERGGRYLVYVGQFHASAGEAERFAEQVRARGFLDAKVDAAPGGTVLRPEMRMEPTTAEDILQAGQRRGVTFTAEESQQLADILKKQEEELSRGGETAETITRLQEQMALLKAEQKAVVQQLQEERTRQALLAEKKENLRNETTNHISAGRFNEAGRAIEELRKIDPGLATLLEERLTLERATKSTTSASDDRTAQGLAQQARDLESRGDLQAAQQLWLQVRDKATGALADEARQKISELNQRIIDANNQQSGSAASATSQTITYVILGAVGLVVLVVIAFVVMLTRQRKREKEMIEQMQRRSSGAGAAPAPAPAAPKKAEKPAKAAPAAPATGSALSGMAAAPPPAAMPSVNIFGDEPKPGAKSAPTKEETPQTVPATAPPTESSSIELPGFASAPPAAPPETNVRIRPGVTSPAPGQGETIQLSPPAAVAPNTPSPVPPSSDLLTPTPLPVMMNQLHEAPTTFVDVASMPPAGDVAAATPGGGVVAAPALAGVFFQQDFEAEQVGQPPKGWKGQYEYSTLLISEDGANGPKSKCMRFEKKTGAGGAYYALKFPDASGRICAEFDIRCDDKNRYLIGFYIEKDEDFRQAISTIVHRTNTTSPPTLRLQGETAPYEFGKWVHVKFIIDLPRSLVDGWVDDVSVAAGVRLAQAPKVLNTLSIRDNSATTGILMIDNVKIYRIA